MKSNTEETNLGGHIFNPRTYKQIHNLTVVQGG